MKVLGRWATVGYAILAVVLGAAITAVARRYMMPTTQIFDLQRRISDGTNLAFVTLVSTPVLVLTLMLASRRSGSSALAYLGLDIPRRRHIAITVVGVAIWIVFVEALGLVLGRNVSPWTLEIYRSAQADGSFIWLWLAIVVVGPIGEELLFRGFMFRGFVHAPSIVLISLIWSLSHIQYDLLDITEIFVLGLLLGLVRWNTGSTTLTTLLHMLYNLIEFVLV
jgi:membrane protease YdiL (CAAX protease family)